MSQQPLVSPSPHGSTEPIAESARELAVDRLDGAPRDRLDRVARGDLVRVVGIEEEDGGEAIARRLDDLGLRPGTIVRVLRRAPLGDPTVYELHGYQLCLRRSESERVRVVPFLEEELEDTLEDKREGTAGPARV